MTGVDARRHASDGDLVRLLDGELDGSTGAAVRRHLETCDECARRWRRLERDSATLDGLLTASGAALEPPASPAQGPGPGPGRAGRARRAVRRSPWWRAAAAVALLAALGLLAPPVRAWVASGIDGVRQWIGAPARAAPDPGASPGTGTTVVRLPAPGPELVVETARPGPGSTLAVRRVAGEDAVIEVASTGATIVVTEAGFRLEDSAPDRTYALGVPAGVERLLIRSDGARTTIAVPPDSALRIPLSGPH